MRCSDRPGDTWLITAVLVPCPRVLAAFPKQGHRSWSVLQSPSVGFQWPTTVLLSKALHLPHLPPFAPPGRHLQPCCQTPRSCRHVLFFLCLQRAFLCSSWQISRSSSRHSFSLLFRDLPGRVRPCGPHTACGPYPWSPSLCGSQSPRMLSSLTVEPCPL